ncbi:MAG: HAD-IA family hydrolase [Clostridia bacterium]|nr:HAD-IA family hydrolase [Clostridia bacterium]
MSFTQRGRIVSSGIDAFFDDYFISEEIGFGKPDKEYFDAVMRAIPNFDISKACVIGDSLTADIKGGNDSGITTIWYNRRKITNTTDICPAYTAYSYAQILDILNKTN